MHIRVLVQEIHVIFWCLFLGQSLTKRKRARLQSSHGSYAEVPFLCGDDLFILRSSPCSESVDIKNYQLQSSFFFFPSSSTVLGLLFSTPYKSASTRLEELPHLSVFLCECMCIIG